MPRLTVSFSQDIYDSIDRLAVLQGVSRSRLINDYLSSALPAIKNTASLIEKFRDATDAQRLTFKSVIEEFSDSVDDDLKNFERHVESLGKLHLVETPT